MPFAIFFHYLFCKRLILDGYPGIYVALREIDAEALISLELLEARLRMQEEEPDPDKQ